MGYEIEIDFQPSRDHGWKVHTFALKGACLSSYSLRRIQWIRHCPADPCKSEFITILWIGINISIVMQCNAMQFQQLILQSCYIIKEWVYSLMTGIIIHRNMNWRWIAILRSLKCLDYIKTVDYIITDLPLLMLRTGQCAVRTGTSVSWFLVNLVQEKLKPPRRSSSS